jgi:hypothetical protein
MRQRYGASLVCRRALVPVLPIPIRGIPAAGADR